MGRPPESADYEIAIAIAFAIERHGLSQREAQVLRAICRGLDRVDVARQLGIALSTYDKHVASIRKKTGMRAHQLAVRLLRWLIGLESDWVC